MRTLIASLLVAVACTPALAGPQFCSDEADTYYIEKIPFGFAVVRIAQADFCRKEFDATKYVCNGDPDYTMDFVRDGDDLAVTFPDGGTSLFAGCVFDHPEAHQ